MILKNCNEKNIRYKLLQFKSDVKYFIMKTPKINSVNDEVNDNDKFFRRQDIQKYQE